MGLARWGEGGAWFKAGKGLCVILVFHLVYVMYTK